ncbi:hypothetical protein NUW58_g8306 [Xylaria curta]|uniref:Uncharacterized protein n=1 Tax=Xylaria curta TaxID=42375 RepID=A0ACC1NAY1_9PEZI|nr:hypothetical protein NUW58_g8306 [Xylaria curta]
MHRHLNAGPVVITAFGMLHGLDQIIGFSADTSGFPRYDTTDTTDTHTGTIRCQTPYHDSTKPSMGGSLSSHQELPTVVSSTAVLAGPTMLERRTAG